LKDLGIDAGVILNWMLGREGVRLWIGFDWLWVGYSLGLL